MYYYIALPSFNAVKTLAIYEIITVMILSYVTLGLLVLMGTLECMLHSLRL